MTKILWLEEQIYSIKNIVRRDEERLSLEPYDKALNFFSAAPKTKLDDLLHQLYLEKAKRKCESLEMHLSGTQLYHGSVPLKLLSKITGAFNDLIETAAWYLRTGDDSKTISENFINDLDLRLGGISGGSSRLYFIGKTNPDLSGESSLESAYEKIFLVLSSDENQFYDHIHAIGQKATNHLHVLVKALESQHVATDLIWNSPTDLNYHWKGRLDEVSRIRHMLKNVGETQKKLMTVTGEVLLLNRTGRIKIHNFDTKEDVSVRFPSSLYEKVKNLHLGEKETFWLEQTSYFDHAKQQTISKYKLISIGLTSPSIESKNLQEQRKQLI